MKRLIGTLVLALVTLGLAQQDVTITYMTANRTNAYEFAQQQAQDYMSQNPHTIGGEEYNVTVEVL